MVSFADLPFNPAANPLPATVAQSALYGENQEPLGYRLLDHIPNATSVMGWNAWRASNTILGNYTASRPTSEWGGRLRNHMPGRFSRMSSVDDITGASGYTPFDILARTGNWAMRHGNANIDKGFAKLDLDSMTDEARDVAQKRYDRVRSMRPGEGEEYFSGGTYARLSTAYRMDTMSGARAARAQQGAATMIRNSNPELYTRMYYAHNMGSANPNITNRNMGDYVSMSGKGTYSNYISGYMRGASHQVDDAVLGAANKHWQRGAGKAAQHLSIGGIKPGERITRAAFKTAFNQGTKQGAKFALGAGAYAAGYTIPVVNAAMAVWTAVDLTKMGVELAREIPGFTRDALNSFKGGIQKPVFGTRYVDNEVAATSRQRGVMAIQNSQLNARSVLGNEASGLHAYYS